jgi:hypothetical protein
MGLSVVRPYLLRLCFPIRAGARSADGTNGQTSSSPFASRAAMIDCAKRSRATSSGSLIWLISGQAAPIVPR